MSKLARRWVACAAVAAVSMGVVSLHSDCDWRDLTVYEEAGTVAGAHSSYCPSTSNSTCSACTPYDECHIGGGDTGDCVGQGGVDGCTNAVARKRCKGTWYYWYTCNNNKATCGSSHVPTACVPVTDGGIIVECNKPTTGCTVGGSTDCNGC